MNSAILGIDIGGTNTKFGFVTENGEVLGHYKIKTNSTIGFKDFIKLLKVSIDEEVSKFSEELNLISIGIGVPNANPLNGCMEYPPNLSWEYENVIEVFSDVFKLPVFMDNDANIAAVGEKKFGLGIHLENFIVITLGTGVGVGTYINESLYYGSHGIGSEAGHVIVEPNGRLCNCGHAGHLESYVSGRGIKQTYFELSGEDLSFREVVAKYHSNNFNALKAVELSADYLALALVNFSALLCPQAFILTGGVTSLGERFRSQVEAKFEELCYKPFKNKSKVLLSEIASEYGAILGAASLALKK